MRKVRNALVLTCIMILLLTGCTENIPEEKVVVEAPIETPNEIEEIEEIIVVEEMKDPKELIDLSLNPNEAGQVMILMYHNIGEEEAEWTRTGESFRKDLVTLYERGYRAVRLQDYVNNNMDVEEGMSPVVITFDDGNENNFKMIENEKGEDLIDPNSAIGIMESFDKDYPGFNITASFFVFGNNIFRQPEFTEFKLKYLVENGYDIGNHTIDHRGMKKLEDKEIIQEVIGKQVENIAKILPDYNVNTYALCYGERPKNKDLEIYLNTGVYDEKVYENIAILNVGWDPAESPISNKFNPLSLPRIRASETKVDNVGMYNWLEYFDKNPGKRYISDGVKEVITIPKKLEDKIDIVKVGEKELYFYGE